MRTDDISAGGALVLLEQEELLILSNTLNLVCHGLETDQFATVIGAELQAAQTLWQAVSEAFDGVAAAASGPTGGDE